MIELLYDVNGTELSVVDRAVNKLPLPTGLNNFIKLKFSLGGWDDMTAKELKFYMPDGVTVYTIPLVDITDTAYAYCILPGVLFTRKGTAKIAVVGKTSDTTITTNRFPLPLVEGGGEAGMPLPDPSATYFDRLMADLEAIAAAAHSVSYYPQTLTEEEQAQARENVGALSDDDLDDYRTSSAQDLIDAGKQSLITNENKLAYSLLSGTPTIPAALSELSEDSTHRLVTDTEKTTWNGKANTSDIPANTSDLTNDSGFVQGTLIVAQRSNLTTANKTNAEIYAAYQAGRQIIFEDYEDSNLFDLIYCTTTEAWFAQAFPTGIYLFKLINNVLTSSTVLFSNYQTKNINDAGGYFTVDTVEGALQELGAANGNLTAFDSTASAGAAEHLKNVQAFVARMNGVSSGIGMTNTTWMTPSGLYTPSASISYSTAYNSHTTANDLMRLLILCRHTPEAYESMSRVTYEFTLSGEQKQTDNILLNGARYKTWASTYGYTMLAAKGGSLGGTDGEIGANGILNVAMILKDSTENVYAWVVVGLQNTETDKNTLLVLAHDLIEMCKGEPATQEILDAAGREPYPVGMACCQLTESGTFAEDIAELENAVVYNGDAVRVSASTAKMMTMCVEALNTQANHLITLTPDDMVGGSGFAELSAGDVISVKDAMAVCMMQSDNALATALGRDAGQRMATGESSVFIAHRNETSYADIVAAISAGKDVIVEAAISGSLYQMRFARKLAADAATPNVLYFFGMAAKDLYYTSISPDDTWSSVSAVSMQEKLTAGEHVTISGNTISVSDVIPIMGSITASTNLSTLTTGMYRVYGITHTDLPEQTALYGNLLQTDGNYKVQIFFGGKTGEANIYVRRWQTGSASFTAWKSMQSAAITDAGGYFTTDTVEAALQSIGAELAGINTLVGSGVIA